ncbi:hypothetical protein D3C85_1790210 [compost metagenome]
MFTQNEPELAIFTPGLVYVTTAWQSSSVKSVKRLLATIRDAICFLTVTRLALSPQVVPLFANDNSPELLI